MLEWGRRMLAGAGLLVWVVGVCGADGGGVDVSKMQWMRAITVTRAGLNCAVLDPGMFPHAGVGLRDVRLVGPDGREVPYVLTLSGTGPAEAEAAVVRGVKERERGVVLTLGMPRRAYTDVELDLRATDFVARAMVAVGGRELGELAVWDLSQERLGRSTTLHLGEMRAGELTVDLQPVAGELRPGMVRGATVPPARSGQTRFTVAERVTGVRQKAGETVAEAELPARVPVERVRVDVGGTGSFARVVRVEGRTPTGESETVTGEIARTDLVRDGMRLHEERLEVPATLGANLQAAARVRVVIENGGAPALPVRAVELETREQQVCFDAAAAGKQVQLLYGDKRLHAPEYPAYAQRYATESVGAEEAGLGLEERNPAWAGERDERTLRQRHPRMVDLLLVLGVCFVGGLMLRSERLRV